MLLDANLPDDTYSSLLAYRTGTAPLDPDLADAFFDRYGVPVLQAYGATEFAGGVAGWTLQDFKDHWKAKRGAVGRVNKGVDARIVDPESGAVLAPASRACSNCAAAIPAPRTGPAPPTLPNSTKTISSISGAVTTARSFAAASRSSQPMSPPRWRPIPPSAKLRSSACPTSGWGEVPVAGYLLKAGASAPTTPNCALS